MLNVTDPLNINLFDKYIEDLTLYSLTSTSEGTKMTLGVTIGISVGAARVSFINVKKNQSFHSKLLLLGFGCYICYLFLHMEEKKDGKETKRRIAYGSKLG